MGEAGLALVVDAASGRPVAQLPSGPPAFAGLSASSEPAAQAVPLQASVRMDKPFSLSDGSPLPRWLSLDRERNIVAQTDAQVAMAKP